MTDNPSAIPGAHITAQSLLMPTLRAWRYFLEDQGSSPHTDQSIYGRPAPAGQLFAARPHRWAHSPPPT